MKKTTLVLLLFLTAHYFAQAQNAFRFGIQASPALTWMSTSDKNINGNGANLGFKLGLLGEYDISESYSFFAGVNFAFNHGGTLKYNEEGKYWPTVTDSVMAAGANLKHSFKLIEIPFGLKMRTNEFGFLRYYAELPIFTVGIITKSTGDVEAANVNLTDEDISKEMRDSSMSWGFGAGVEYNISSSTKLVGGISYQSYFLDLTKKTDADDSKAALNGLTLKIGVLF